MSDGAYTPGWSPHASAFMERRTADSHGQEILGHLRPGMDLLDLGCGPGSITVGLARAAAPGRVTAIDREASQIALLVRRAAAEGVSNVEAVAGDALALPLADASVDAVFSHALFEHLPDPVAALREVIRVVRPGGVVVVVSPDWGGFVLAPAEPEVEEAIRFYERIQTANGGDVRAGRSLGAHMRRAGLAEVAMSARYEVYEDRAAIADYLASRIEASPDQDHSVELGWASAANVRGLARALREWSAIPGGMFAQAWISATGRVPSGG